MFTVLGKMVLRRGQEGRENSFRQRHKEKNSDETKKIFKRFSCALLYLLNLVFTKTQAQALTRKT